MKEKYLNCVSFISVITMIISLSMLVYIFLQDYYFVETNIFNMECPNNFINVSFTNYDSPSYIFDEQYFSIERDTVSEFVENDNTDTFFKYISEGFDCDEFGIILLANIIRFGYNCNMNKRFAFGLITGKPYQGPSLHLINFFIDKNLTYWCLEPQNDNIIQCNNMMMDFQFLII